ncbi:hypothetical protein [Roseomonas sp. WA12]
MEGVALGGRQRATGSFRKIRCVYPGVIAVKARRRPSLKQAIGVQIDGVEAATEALMLALDAARGQGG